MAKMVPFVSRRRWPPGSLRRFRYGISPRRIRRLFGRYAGIAALILVAAIVFFDRDTPSASLAPVGNISVYDGDTIRLGDERIRIVGLDTPERGHRAQCNEEALAAERAREALIGEIESGHVALHRQGTDRYGRTLARVTVDGRDVAATLIAQGLARPYDGGRRAGWCG